MESECDIVCTWHGFHWGVPTCHSLKELGNLKETPIVNCIKISATIRTVLVTSNYSAVKCSSVETNMAKLAPHLKICKLCRDYEIALNKTSLGNDAVKQVLDPTKNGWLSKPGDTVLQEKGIFHVTTVSNKVADSCQSLKAAKSGHAQYRNFFIIRVPSRFAEYDLVN